MSYVCQKRPLHSLAMWIGNRTLFATCFLAAVLSVFMGCSANAAVSLKGAGATAPYLVYSKWVEAYRNAKQRVNLEYEPTGSGAGIQALKAQAVDFAASDMPLTDEEIGMMAGSHCIFRRWWARSYRYTTYPKRVL
jgi:ABC-type phosphate transport system substrate-binding protein